MATYKSRNLTPLARIAGFTHWHYLADGGDFDPGIDFAPAPHEDRSFSPPYLMRPGDLVTVSITIRGEGPADIRQYGVITADQDRPEALTLALMCATDNPGARAVARHARRREEREDILTYKGGACGYSDNPSARAVALQARRREEREGGTPAPFETRAPRAPQDEGVCPTTPVIPGEPVSGETRELIYDLHTALLYADRYFQSEGYVHNPHRRDCISRAQAWLDTHTPTPTQETRP